MALAALLIAVREDWYAVELARVQEVLEPRAITRVPGAPGAVLGVINVRGTIVGVLDTATLLGMPAIGRAGTSAVAVVLAADGAFGLATTAVPVTEELDDDLGPSPLEAGVRRWRASVGPAVELEIDTLVGAVA